MDTIFTRGPSIAVRLMIAVIMSCVLIFVDHKLDGFQSPRLYFNSLLSPLQYIANLPSLLLDVSAERLTSREDLIDENQTLKDQLLIASEKLQRFDSLEKENSELRALLEAPTSPQYRKIVTELMSVDRNPFAQQIMINKGALNGVFRSQALIDENGIIGQVMEVGTTNSRVLLITDVTHSIPVRSQRNNIQFIASGSGGFNELYLEHVTHSAEVEAGDVLVSSGLGGVFPAGYPVAVVSKVNRDERQVFAQVLATPTAALDRIRYVLLLEPETQAESLNGDTP
jgi:rod shape-determining protein MreC